ncbi:30S ribosomal protein S17 [Candidatus Woesearchaeota archaeon]|nr:30S ribosomal protein S17 [Candidatus Woesearchaeota archaeon]
MERKSKNIGIKVKSGNAKECKDKGCPFHGSLKCRGKILTGVIISTKMQKTATIEFIRQAYIPKYERYEKRRTRLKAHNPSCINAKKGDIVRISECRPLSKTKNFVIIENLGKEKGFEERIESLEEGKTRKTEKEELKAEDASGKSESN